MSRSFSLSESQSGSVSKSQSGSHRESAPESTTSAVQGADASAANTVRKEYDKSCAALGRDRIDAYLAHDADDLERPGVVEVLRTLCDEDRIGAFGASVYTPEQAMTALAVDGLGAIQAPLSVFNWSLADTGALSAA